jgi:hypothetical protein
MKLPIKLNKWINQFALFLLVLVFGYSGLIKIYEYNDYINLINLSST